MKNNNNLIIENKAPIEIVQELKPEYHQTYEEFIKTYQENEKVNYDDLHSEDISTSKGYGPCSDGRNMNHCYCSREELQKQITSLQSQLTVAVNNQNITNINVVQTKINLIIAIFKGRFKDTTPSWRKNVSAIFKFDRRVNTAFLPWNTNIEYWDVRSVYFVTNDSNILDFDSFLVFWDSIGGGVASRIGYSYCTQEISLRRIEQIKKFRDILGSGISVYRWGVGGAANEHRGSLENKMRECLNNIINKWDRGEDPNKIGGMHSITIDTCDL